jgi:hypothetical protein
MGQCIPKKEWTLQVAEKESKMTQALVDVDKQFLQESLSLAAK